MTSVTAFIRRDGLTSCYFCNTQKLSYFLLPSFVLLLVLWFNFLLFYHKYSQMSSFMRSAVSFPRTVTNVTIQHLYTGRLIMFSMITNIYNKKTKGPTWMELFTATGKLKKFFFWQLEMFDVCTTGDMAHIFKLLPHTRQHVDACVATTWIACRVTGGAHIGHL